jgi:hypothetical protein
MARTVIRMDPVRKWRRELWAVKLIVGAGLATAAVRYASLDVLGDFGVVMLFGLARRLSGRRTIIVTPDELRIYDIIRPVPRILLSSIVVPRTAVADITRIPAPAEPPVPISAVPTLSEMRAAYGGGPLTAEQRREILAKWDRPAQTKARTMLPPATIRIGLARRHDVHLSGALRRGLPWWPTSRKRSRLPPDEILVDVVDTEAAYARLLEWLH